MTTYRGEMMSCFGAKMCWGFNVGFGSGIVGVEIGGENMLELFVGIGVLRMRCHFWG